MAQIVFTHARDRERQHLAAVACERKAIVDRKTGRLGNLLGDDGLARLRPGNRAAFIVQIDEPLERAGRGHDQAGLFFSSAVFDRDRLLARQGAALGLPLPEQGRLGGGSFVRIQIDLKIIEHDFVILV